jgi:hypothetical protein
VGILRTWHTGAARDYAHIEPEPPRFPRGGESGNRGYIQAFHNIREDVSHSRPHQQQAAIDCNDATATKHDHYHNRDDDVASGVVLRWFLDFGHCGASFGGE